MSHERLISHERGRPQSWETLDADLRAEVERAVDQISEELDRSGFVGAYLHGSLSTGSFYRPKSDIDILVVVEEEMSPEWRERVAKTLCDLSDQLPLVGDYEVSVLRRNDIVILNLRSGISMSARTAISGFWLPLAFTCSVRQITEPTYCLPLGSPGSSS